MQFEILKEVKTGTVISVSFKGKNQAPLIMVTELDMENGEDVYGRVLFTTWDFLWRLRRRLYAKYIKLREKCNRSTYAKRA